MCRQGDCVTGPAVAAALQLFEATKRPGSASPNWWGVPVHAPEATMALSPMLGPRSQNHGQAAAHALHAGLQVHDAQCRHAVVRCSALNPPRHVPEHQSRLSLGHVPRGTNLCAPLMQPGRAPCCGKTPQQMLHICSQGQAARIVCLLWRGVNARPEMSLRFRG